MAEQLQLEVVTPERMVLNVSTDWVTVPGSEGELGILPEHVPLVTALDSGVLQYSADGAINRVAVHYGYAQVQGTTITVLAQMAEQANGVDLGRAQDAERRAREKLAELISTQNDEENRMDKYEAKLKRALVRQSIHS